MEWFESRRQAVDRRVSEHLKVLKTPHSRLGEAVRYAMSNGGKRLRPILVLECCGLCGGRDDEAWPAALAIECVHTFSLVHDDLPAMDDDDLRRGKPTVHRAYDEGTAVLAGDWLLAHAFELLSGREWGGLEAVEARRMNETERAAEGRGVVESKSDAWRAATLTGVLARGTAGMIIGQAADIDGEGRAPDAELVRFVHRRKTGDLIEASCVMGAITGGGDEGGVAMLGEFGRRLGQAFQIADDVLDATGDEARTGKRVSKDASSMKQTYPAALGLEKSRQAARDELAAALAVLDNLGRDAANLRGLARYCVERDR